MGATIQQGYTAGSAASGPTLLTEQATTSGTTKDFTIPAGAKRITIMLSGVSNNNATGTFGVQLGDAGGVETTGYVSYFSPGGTTSSTQLLVADQVAAADLSYGRILLARMNGSHKWISSSTIYNDTGNIYSGAGEKTTSAELTTVRFLTSATFDAGAVNVMWE